MQIRKSETKMAKPTDKTKEQVRFRRERNLVAKNNKHRGGYHTLGKSERRSKLSPPNVNYSQEEINEWWEINI